MSHQTMFWIFRTQYIVVKKRKKLFQDMDHSTTGRQPHAQGFSGRSHGNEVNLLGPVRIATRFSPSVTADEEFGNPVL